MQIAIIGAGYVGLVSAACFAKLGHHVICADSNRDKIDGLARGEIPIYEPGLEALVALGAQENRLEFTTNLHDCVKEAQIVFIAVGTPSGTGGIADMSQVNSAIETIIPALAEDVLVVLKSTVIMGTARQIADQISQARPGLKFTLANNPEFLQEGSAVNNFLQPERIILGVDSARAERILRDVYAPMEDSKQRIKVTNLENSELIKYATNAFLAMKVSFINELADLCEKAGGNVNVVAEGIGLDSRIGPQFLKAGPGYGGSCFPKDTAALCAHARDAGLSLRLIEATIEVNQQRKSAIAERILAALASGEVAGKGRKWNVGVLGVAYKAQTSDMRSAPALDIINRLLQEGVTVRAFDPQAMNEGRQLLPATHWSDDAYDAAKDADILVLLTGWPEFQQLDFTKIANVMRGKLLFDYRNHLEPGAIENAGLDYIGVGRGHRPAHAAADKREIATG